MHDTAPLPLLKDCPGEHCVAEAAPLPETNEPAGASVHDAAPAALLNDPDAHRLADVAPGPVAYEPAGASVQAAAPVEAGERFPARTGVGAVRARAAA